jgi:ketosteroid isomerase-like protein
MDRAASNYSDGGATGFETLVAHVTPDLAYLVEVERFEARVGGSDEVVSGALRVTSVLRPENGGWKVVHRHADPDHRHPTGGVGDSKLGGCPLGELEVLLLDHPAYAG